MQQMTIDLDSLTPAQLKVLKEQVLGKEQPTVSPSKLVTEFHETYGLPVRSKPVADIPEADLRVELIREEFAEYVEALAAGDVVGIADALGDTVYVLYGAALCHGIDLDEVLAEIQRSNMSKLGLDGKPIYRLDGKVLKGPNFVEPDLAAVIERQIAANS